MPRKRKTPEKKEIKKSTKYNPKITPILIEGLVRRGLNQSQIAKRLNISENTLIRWRKEYPEIKQIFEQTSTFQIKTFEVEDALYKRALGYEYNEKVEEMYFEPTGEIGRDGKPVMRLKFVKQRNYKKHVPPDINAIKALLVKYAPEDWGELKDLPVQVATQVNVDMPKMVIGQPKEEIKNKKVIRILKPEKEGDEKNKKDKKL